MKYSIKELRNQIGLTQSEVSDITGIPIRPYKNYENDPNKEGSIKYQYILKKLQDYAFVDETHGILKHDDIVAKACEVFRDYDVDYCYLFGSYARNDADADSDVDLHIEKGKIRNLFQICGFRADIMEALGKDVDIVSITPTSEEFRKNLLREEILLYEA